MGDDKGHRRGRRKGITLLRTLIATFKWRIVLAGFILIIESAVRIAQVDKVPGAEGIEESDQNLLFRIGRSSCDIFSREGRKPARACRETGPTKTLGPFSH